MPNWDPSGIELFDSNGDDIYEVTLSLIQGTYQYKFINGDGWEDEHDQLQSDAICVEEGNRSVTISTDLDIDPVCLGLCEPCPLSYPINITFQADMTSLKSWGWDSNEHELTISSDFGTYTLIEDLLDPFLYVASVGVNVEGEEEEYWWTFKANPYENFTNDGQESTPNRTL